MKKVDLVQNTEEWHKFRETRFGASDANIIMGVSSFMTPFQLWERRLGITKKDENDNNFIQQKGHRLEPKLRSILELQLGHDFPDMVVINDDFPAFMASLDGFCEELNATAEFKYVGQEYFEQVQRGEMLEHYIPQVQQQLFLSNADKCYFMVGTDDKESEKKGEFKFALIEVPRDQEYIEKKLIPTVHAFIDCVNNQVPPKLMKDDTLDMSKDEKLDDLIHRYKLMKESLEEAEKMVEKTKEEIFKMLKHTKVNCNGVMLYNITAKDGIKIDYEGFIAKENLVIPQEFISVRKGASSKKITFPKVVEEKSPEEMIVKGAELPKKERKPRTKKVVA